MTDLEISRRLALAIGWTENRLNRKGDLDPDVVIFWSGLGIDDCVVKVWVSEDFKWRVFDYRDPAVIWPIAERYGAFPSPMVTSNFKKHKEQGYPDTTGWELFQMDYTSSTFMKSNRSYYCAATAAKAVALAVIGSTS